MTLGLIDTHLHLDADEFEADRPQLWQAARAQGVVAALIPAVHPAQWPQQRDRLAGFPGLHHAWGVHPCFVDAAHRWAEAQSGRALSDEEAVEFVCAALEAWIGAHGAVAIGEIGLDRFVTEPAWSRQCRWFDAQVALAKRLGLPILVHCRRSVEDIRQRVRQSGVGGILHAFNGSLAQAEDLIARGFCLGFGGAMTYERAQHLRRLVQTLPLAGIVLETDAPDIPPAWRHDRRTQPADLLRYAERVAQWRGMEVEEVARQTSANACRVVPMLDVGI